MEDKFFKVSTYDYHLPERLIAQNPVVPRDSSRMIFLSKMDGTIEHRRFSDILDYLKPGDLLIRNNTKVMASRLIGVKPGMSSEVELLLLSPVSKHSWEALVKPGRRLKPGVSVFLSNGVEVKVEKIRSNGLREVSFPPEVDVMGLLDEIGSIPLPPYIKTSIAPDDSYQTVFARETTSAAAPTAGLHFTDELIEKLMIKGVEIEDVTLDVGLGTFRPVKAHDLRDHPMHTERCRVSRKTADAVNRAKAEGRRVIAVGTTSVRTMESMAEGGKLSSGETSTSLFIYPGYRFQIVDGMVTNFHLPQSTLLMLVSAFAGYELTMDAYRQAVDMEYRFFSFGDAMLIL